MIEPLHNTPIPDVSSYQRERAEFWVHAMHDLAQPVQALALFAERLRRLEVAEPMQAKAAEWVQSAVWAAAAAAVMFMAGKAGLF